MRRQQLAAALEAVAPHPSPDPSLEQYNTPGVIAADFLWEAREDIAGKRVLDLGCGTGVLAIGAALLGAAEVVGFDVDGASIDLARQQAERQGLPCRFEIADVTAWAESDFDVAVMNPPFGAQKSNRGADRLFLAAAARSLRAGGACWTLAPRVSARFLVALAKENRWRLEQIAQWDYPLTATMAHHTETVRTVPVIGFRFQV